MLRLSALAADKVDIVMSHDWPNTIEQWGDTQTLIRKKPFFEKEISTQSLGSPPLMQLLQQLKPAFWFSAHLHVKFAAIYPHGRTAAGTQEAQASENANPEALDIDLDFDEDSAAADAARVEDKPASVMDSASESGVTRFLALHKCLSHTPFLQVIEHASPLDDELAARKAAVNNEQRVMPRLRFSPRWLAITRAFHPHLSLSYRQAALPDPAQPDFAAQIQAELRAVDEHLASLAPRAGKRKLDQQEASDDPLDVFGVQRFVRTAPALHEPGGDATGQPAWYTTRKPNSSAPWRAFRTRSTRVPTNNLPCPTWPLRHRIGPTPTRLRLTWTISTHRRQMTFCGSMMTSRKHAGKKAQAKHHTAMRRKTGWNSRVPSAGLGVGQRFFSTRTFAEAARSCG